MNIYIIFFFFERYRGASPIQYAILNNDKITGITIQELHHEIFDAGKILRQITHVWHIVIFFVVIINLIQ